VAGGTIIDHAGVVISELTPADRAALAFSFSRLGARSRYQRFMAVKQELTVDELIRMTSVDHWHHEALIARSPSPRAPIGIARYVRGAEFDAAEVAVEITDRWQRQGIGLALLLALRNRALGAGIRRFTATMLADNGGAIALARRVGPYRVLSARSGELELVVDLSPARSARPAPRRSPPPRWRR